MFNRQAADSDGGGGAAVRLSAPLSRALRVWVFFLSLSLSLPAEEPGGRISAMAGDAFFSDVIVVAPPSRDGQHHILFYHVFVFLFIFECKSPATLHVK